MDAVGDPGIFLHLIARDAALAAVAGLGPFDPAAKPLWGIPFAVKDNIDAAGAPTTAACPAFAYTAERDAFVVERLRRAGAILIGKTNLDQFATGLVGLRTPYPAPKNALDPEIVPGGSSSGSAVAVAQGIVQLRARHRHGGLRPRAGGAQRDRRPQADPRRALEDGRGPGLPDARYGFRVRADRRGCL